MATSDIKITLVVRPTLDQFKEHLDYVVQLVGLIHAAKREEALKVIDPMEQNLKTWFDVECDLGGHRE